MALPEYNLFSKENINKAVGTGIDLLGQSLASKNNQNEINKATELEVAKTNALLEQQNASAARAKWLIPTLIIGGIVLVGTVIAVIVIKRKKTN